MEKGESSFSPQDRIGQLTMRTWTLWTRVPSWALRPVWPAVTGEGGDFLNLTHSTGK